MKDFPISVCLTNYNRTELLYEAVSKVLMDERVNEIVISDDCSQVELYNTVVWQFKSIEKVKIYRNESNVDCYLNKRRAVELATNEWVCIWDSDNIFSKDYIDRIENLIIGGINSKTVYQPDFAKPHFNFKAYSGKNVTKENVSTFMGDATFQTMLNAFNYFVNRSEFLRVFDDSVNPVTSDSIFHNYNWLNAGNSIYVVPGLEYEHRIHDGSHYREKVNLTPRGFHNDIVNKLMLMR